MPNDETTARPLRMNAAEEPNPKLFELSELLVGTWQVDGPNIKGQAEYQPKNGVVS